MTDWPKLCAEIAPKWTPDCQGKQDYDFPLLSVSTRYWPRGGGFHTFNSATGEWAGNESRPDIRPSATSSFMIGDTDIASKDFEGDTETEVKTAVEAWVAEKAEAIILAAHAALCPRTGGNG